MDWNSSNLRAFVSRPDSPISFLYNYNCDPFPGVEMKHPTMAETVLGSVPGGDTRNMSYGNQEKKKRLSSEQLDALERNFQEEIKLDPDRKMKLSRELGLQPRQIAVWFQNRRARWKAKQLERLYDALKQEYNAISREKHKLQEEVLKLKGMVREQVMNRMQVSAAGYTEISGEETVESSSRAQATSHQIGECNYVFNADDYNAPVSPAYWPGCP